MGLAGFLMGGGWRLSPDLGLLPGRSARHPSPDMALSQGFRPPRRRPSHFLLSGQEKVTKEKATPAPRIACGASDVPCVARRGAGDLNVKSHSQSQSQWSQGVPLLKRRNPPHPFALRYRSVCLNASVHRMRTCLELTQGSARRGTRFDTSARTGVGDFKHLSAPPLRGLSRPTRASAVALRFPTRHPRRATQPASGKRRECSSAWMRESVPARRRRVAQGTVAAVRQRRDARVAISLPPFSWRLKRKEVGRRRGGRNPATTQQPGE